VVAYTVIAEADNPQGKLLPGMTANADIIIETHRDVLKVPVAALRWNPSGQNTPTRVGMIGGPGLGGPGFGGGPGGFRRGGGFGGSMGGGGQAGGQRGVQGARGAGALAALPDQLGLDAGQRKQWETIQAELRQKMAAAFASAGDDRAQARETARKAREEAFAKLEPLLRPDQKQTLAALRASMAQGRSRGGAGGTVYVLRDGKPTPIPVRVGAGDGTNTEIQGALRPGDQVIVGGGPRAKARVSSPFGPGGSQAGNQTRART
jgi:HlyD family secretion protein